MAIVNIILAGGSGTRLWPISRTLMPKQFLKINGQHSFFQQTVLRHKEFAEKTVVVVNDTQYFLALEQLEEIGEDKNSLFLIETIAKNTAPAVCLSCLSLNPDDIAVVTPSDHFITPSEKYVENLKQSLHLLERFSVMTFGVKPDNPNTGYGYIETGEEIEKGVFKTEAFKEKPDKETAKRYLAKGNFYWNAGIFAFKVKNFLNEIKKHAPDIYNACIEAFVNRKTMENVVRITKDYMEKIPANSVDYAVMEKTREGITKIADFQWSDVGSFDALYKILKKDGDGNAVVFGKNIINKNCSDNLIFASPKRTTALIDLKNLLIVDTPDAILIANKGSSEKVKEIAEILKEKNAEIVFSHTTSFRPWGSFTVIEENTFYKVKKISVKPGKRLSLQYHKHRSEHWVVVKGEATVQIGSHKYVIKENESVYVPVGEKHRLENATDKELEIIEIQVGYPLKEEDIVRIEDDYKRE